MECREVVVRSSMLILRVLADLDRMYMDGGLTVGGSGDTDSCFSLGVSLLSGVPHIGCDLAGYLQQGHFLLQCRSPISHTFFASNKLLFHHLQILYLTSSK